MTEQPIDLLGYIQSVIHEQNFIVFSYTNSMYNDIEILTQTTLENGMIEIN